jgi:hypothetical protein
VNETTLSDIIIKSIQFIIIIKPHSALHVIILNLFPHKQQTETNNTSYNTISLSSSSSSSSSLDFLLKMRRGSSKKTGQSNSNPSAADLFRSGTGFLFDSFLFSFCFIRINP